MRNSYFIHNWSDKEILIKTRGKEEPTIFCDGLGVTYAFGRIFKKLFKEKCIVYRGDRIIQIFEINDELKLARKGEFKQENDNHGFDTFDYDKIVVIDAENILRMYQIELEKEEIKIKKLQEIEVKGVEGRKEKGLNVIADSEGKYLLTSQSHSSQFSSNISVYKVKENYDLELKSLLDLSSQNIKLLPSFIFLDYHLDELIFAGKSSVDGPLFIFSYNPAINWLRVVKEFDDLKRLGDVKKIVKIEDGKLLVVTDKNKVVKLSIKFEV